VIEVREVSGHEFDAVGELIVRAWREGYREVMPADFLATMSATERAEVMRGIVARGVHRLRVAVEDERILGMIVYGPCRDQPGIGEVVALNVDPGAWRRGAGGALLAHATAGLATDFPQAVLWAVVGNERARVFYEKRGWTRTGVTRIEDWRGTLIEDECYRRTLRSTSPMEGAG
jgi:GNAT superfamily N-acetyltransferase